MHPSLNQGIVRANAEECPICYETSRLAVETNCGHIFCGHCIFHFYEINDVLSEPDCPYCRQRVTLLVPFFSDAERDHPYRMSAQFFHPWAPFPSNVCKIYKVIMMVRDMGWVDYDFGHSTVCQVLPRQMGV